MAPPTNNTQRMVVTGASGFLARVVTQVASRAKWDVTTVGRQASTSATHQRCAADEKPDQIARWLETWKPEVIFHGAGSANVRSSFEGPAADLEASLGSWSRWLEAARLWGGRPLMIFPSSAAVYGAPQELPIREETPCRPISPYGFHKHLCEQVGAEYHSLFQVPVVVLRLFSVFGPTQCRLLVHELYQRLCSQSDSLAIMGTGQETRDYILETDVGEAVLHVASQAHLARTHTHPLVYNLASGREISVLSMATLLRDSLRDQRPIVCHGESRSGDPERWCADPSRFCNDHPGWRATPLEEAMAHTLQVWQSAPPEAIKP